LIMSTRNTNQLAPSLPFAERGTVQYDEVIGVNARREGPRVHEEQIAQVPATRAAFAQGFTSSRPARGDMTERIGNVYEVQEAGQANGRTTLGGTDPNPSWVMDYAARGAMARGTAHDGEQKFETTIGRGGRRENPATTWE
jgi:hypothetical protein